MKKIKRQSKKLLSLILSMVMLMTMLITLDAGTVSASAADYTPFSLEAAENICVYVPETIYLNPKASPDGYSFQYFVDRENIPNGSLNAISEKTVGNVFIFIPQADRIVDVKAVGSGMTAVIDKTSTESGVNTVSTTVTGYSSDYASGVLNWTVRYIDAETNETYTITASSYVYAPNVAAGSSIISVTTNPGYENTFHSKTYICTTAWIVGAHKVTDSTYALYDDSTGGMENTYDDRGAYMAQNYLVYPDYPVPTADRKRTDVYNVGLGGSGYWSTNSDIKYQNGGAGTIYIDSSRYSNLSQIPDLYFGIDCNYAEYRPMSISLTYDWYQNCGGNLFNVNLQGPYRDSPSTGSFGTLSSQRAAKINIASPMSYNGTHTLIVKGTGKSEGNESRTGEGLCYLKCSFFDKGEIREIYNLVTGSFNYLQSRFFKASVWSRFSELHSRIGEVLGQPDLDMSSFNMGELAEYYDLASAMAACKLAEYEGGTTASFTDYSGNVQTVRKSSYLADDIPADYSALYDAIAEAEALNEGYYTYQTWNALQSCLDDARSVPADLTADYQDLIDEKTANLLYAIDCLKFDLDFSELEAVIAEAEELSLDYYTDETVDALLNALDYAHAVLESAATQEIIDEAACALMDAVCALRYMNADYSSVNAALALIPDETSIYTDESMAALMAAVDSIVYDLTVDRQAEVDAMAEAVFAAIEALELKPVEEEHVWGSWYMVVNPTLTSTGLMRRDCQTCGEYEEMIVPVLIPDFVTGVSLGSKSIALSMGDKVILYSEVEPATAVNQDLIWESTDPNVVTVSQSGKITAVGVGVANIIVRSAENPNIMDYCMVRVASLIASGNFTVIDNGSGYVYGLSPNLASLDGYVDLVDETTSIVIDEASIGTGTEINIVREDEIIDTYTAVIFGDINGDGWYDGTDSVLANCLANGILSKEQVGEAVYMAADCNHDGSVDENDAALLEQAGLIIASVDQSKTNAQLAENAAYTEYLSLIDQTVELGEQTISIVTEDETAPAGAEAQTEKAAETERTAQHFDFFRTVLRFLSKIMNYIVHLVKAR